MKTDLAEARKTTLRPIIDVAADLGLDPDDLELYGNYKAKVSMPAMHRILNSNRKRGKLIFVSGITPTKSGEGKTTVSVGLAEAFCKRGSNAIAALRQPSLGPIFGSKGGAAGGGRAQAMPMEDINLHFTGDLHAVAAANNLLAAMLDNHIYYGNELGIDPRTITFRRALDMNDRNLRNIVTGIGGKTNGYPMESGFDITAASEVMAVLCLSESIDDLKQRLGAIVIGQTRSGNPITAGNLGAAGAMALILKDAIKPNLVQTMEGGPMLVHGGPFANIAHGCSSVLGTRLALKLGDYVLTEGGFGADLGFEKFCDIVAATRAPELVPDAVVIVASVRALKLHGGSDYSALQQEDLAALKRGLANLDCHVEIVRRFGLPCVVALNHFAQDTAEEISDVLAHCKSRGWPAALCDVYAKGGDGADELVQLIKEAGNATSRFTPAYCPGDRIMQKLQSLASKVYGADSIVLSQEAEKQLEWLSKHDFEGLPVCVAKTQYSLSDNPELRGAPAGFKMIVRTLHLSAGAGFVVALMGDILTMPGLPRHLAATQMDIDEDGHILSM